MVLTVVLTLFLSVLFGACSPKKNTAASRNYQAFITRYNIYYNGDTHFRETLADMESKYEDDYSRQVFMHPVEAKSDPLLPQPSGNFDRSIEKAQKAIQLRSIKKRPKKKAGKSSDPKYKEWMKREEYNPFLHNAWMMMGRSQYYNGDFLGAASTFFYISRHFKWLPETVVESKLMQALSYVSLDWLFEAENIITRIKPEELTTKRLRELYNFVYADFQQLCPTLAPPPKKHREHRKHDLTFCSDKYIHGSGRKNRPIKRSKMPAVLHRHHTAQNSTHA